MAASGVEPVTVAMRFIVCPLEIPLLPGKTVRECMYKFLDNALLNGVDAISPDTTKALEEGLEFAIEDASRLVHLVSLVNHKLAYEEDPSKHFEPMEFSDGAIVLQKCETVQI